MLSSKIEKSLFWQEPCPLYTNCLFDTVDTSVWACIYMYTSVSWDICSMNVCKYCVLHILVVSMWNTRTSCDNKSPSGATRLCLTYIHKLPHMHTCSLMLKSIREATKMNRQQVIHQAKLPTFIGSVSAVRVSCLLLFLNSTSLGFWLLVVQHEAFELKPAPLQTNGWRHSS